MFDNSVFLGESGGTTVAAVKVNGRYHILGCHMVANAKQVKELFDAAMPIFRAAGGAELLIIGRLPRYLVNPCCGDSGHITNFTEAGYGAQLCAGVKEVGIHLRSLIHTRRIKSAKILNPWVLMGLAGSDSNNPQDVLQLWGADLVHPMETAYTKMAEKIMDEINVSGVMNCRQATSPSAARGQPKHGTMER